jgi:hypothetical protein
MREPADRGYWETPRAITAVAANGCHRGHWRDARGLGLASLGSSLRARVFGLASSGSSLWARVFGLEVTREISSEFAWAARIRQTLLCPWLNTIKWMSCGDEREQLWGLRRFASAERVRARGHGHVRHGESYSDW